ncbi:MAG: hypothetical protein ACI9KE_000005 [Polyangiales bacterium]|jgi:hypothetical protein
MLHLVGEWVWTVWPAVVLVSAVFALCIRLSTKARAATWTPLLALVLLLAGLELSRFDGQPQIAPKAYNIDWTWIVWALHTCTRISMGVALLFLGPLIARVAVGPYSERRVFRAGAAATMPLALGLIVSGAIYVAYLRQKYQSDDFDAEAMLPAIHFAAKATLTVGTSLSLVIAMFFVTKLFNRRPPGSPKAF